MSVKLIESLQNKALYPHPVEYFRVIETHISWVILTGDYAYKIKKPVDLEFLDFSTLEKRKYFCEQELTLNRRLAPQLYLEVLPIYGDEQNPNFTGEGPVLEYALKMQEFSQENLFTKVLDRRELTPELIDKLAKTLARFHIQTEATQDDYLGSPEQVHEPVLQNFDQIRAFLNDPVQHAQLERVQKWAEQTYKQLYETLQERKRQKYIRNCHGDVHLGNIVLSDGQPLIFDCIEFNEPFRWTDVMADLGFLAMDLAYHGREDFAHRLINEYLLYTGDYRGLSVLPYYISYRAVVRAKIALFRLAQAGLSENEVLTLTKNYQNCMHLAEAAVAAATPALIIMYGVAGSGKSTVAKALVEHYGAIQIRSDVERKRLSGLEPHALTYSQLHEKIYTPEMSQKTYQHLAELAESILKAGYKVIVDATFLKEKQRHVFSAAAEKCGVPFVIVHCHATEDFLRDSVKRRVLENRDPSEAGVEVLEDQLQAQEPLNSSEMEHAVSINVGDISESAPILKKLLPRLEEKF